MAATEGVNVYPGVTVGGASIYFANSLRKGIWSAFSGSNKDASLVEATRYLERLPWAGQLASTAQWGAWPRTGVVDKEGREIDAATTPEVIIEATYEMAVRLGEDPDLLDSFGNQSGGNSNIKMVKAGEVSVQFFSPKDGGPLFDWIGASIGHLLAGSNGGSSGGVNGGIAVGAKSSGTGAQSSFSNCGSDYGLSDGYR